MRRRRVGRRGDPQPVAGPGVPGHPDAGDQRPGRGRHASVPSACRRRCSSPPTSSTRCARSRRTPWTTWSSLSAASASPPPCNARRRACPRGDAVGPQASARILQALDALRQRDDYLRPHPGARRRARGLRRRRRHRLDQGQPQHGADPPGRPRARTARDHGHAGRAAWTRAISPACIARRSSTSAGSRPSTRGSTAITSSPWTPASNCA